MNTNIINIDFNNEEHKKVIYKLIKINKFYENDIMLQFYGECKIESFKPMAKELFNKNKIDQFLGGYFITGEKITGNIGYLGMLLYSKQLNVEQLDFPLIHKSLMFVKTVDFLLIDKNYIKKGYGTLLLNHLKSKTYLNTIINVKVVKTHMDTIIWYFKRGFFPVNLEKNYLWCGYHPKMQIEIKEKVHMMIHLFSKSIEKISK